MNTENLKLKFELKNIKKKYDFLFLDHKRLEKHFDTMLVKAVDFKTKELQTKITELEKVREEDAKDYESQIEALKKELIKKQMIIDNDASNSNIPTSKTPIGKKKHIPNTREKTDKLIGGQQGHKRNILKKFESDEITETVPIVADICPKCNSNKIKRLDTYITKHETDYEAVVIKREHQFFDCECEECNNKFRANIPNDLKEENQYGKGVQALAVCLTNETYTPFNKTRGLIKGITNEEINVSEGFIAKLQPRAYDFLEAFEQKLKNHIIKSPFYAWDDSVIKINERDAYLRVYCNNLVSLFFAHEKKDRTSMDEDDIFINTPETTTVVHDHLTSNYNMDYSFINSECMRHLIQRLKKMNAVVNHKWLEDLKKFLTDTNTIRNNLIAKDVMSFTDNELVALDKRFDEIIKQGYQENDYDIDNSWFKEENGLLNDIKKYKIGYLRWFYDFNIPSTNNISERNNRPAKSKMKISGLFKNINYAKYYARIRSYIETCKINGINMITACVRLMRGNPYTLDEILSYKKTD